MRKQIIGVALSAALLLFVPLVAGWFTPEVNWGAADFVAAWLLLLAMGFGVVLALHCISGKTARAVAVSAIVLALALVWAELAVGLFR